MLFHHSSFAYRPGDVIPLGDSWRVRVEDRPAHDVFRLREERFEEIRRAEFSGAVSRLLCNWAYEARAPALQGMRQGVMCDRFPALYEVEIVDPRVPTHRGSLDVLNHDWFATPATDPSARDELVRRYWRGEGIGAQGSELLIAGDLRVVDVLLRPQARPQVALHELFDFEGPSLERE